ncbi:hypothetical protein DCC85_14270 [Paenibacillus sp. CAA11]|uniref:hypothetical protein n=1 Tax=Paenibacillus sp. CAA11 TaxID=1532905 RepID=UPI000D350AA1|nr:hypothetical protein [Paenibacillus sp. CAA11]AWB45275.1 hypothetical protein DCC85_14270 [Paenibacillus sp. CAA11]
MSQNFEKIEIGPAVVEYGEGADMVKFETTIGGVTLTTETTYREQKTDQTGETVVGKRVTGRNVSVEVPFGEYELSIIPKIMAGAEAVTGANGTKINLKTGVGINLIDTAKKAVIKPIAHLNDPDFWVTMPLAYSESDLSYSYNNENERITNVTLRATPDKDNVLAVLGDVTITP